MVTNYLVNGMILQVGRPGGWIWTEAEGKGGATGPTKSGGGGVLRVIYIYVVNSINSEFFFVVNSCKFH